MSNMKDKVPKIKQTRCCRSLQVKQGLACNNIKQQVHVEIWAIVACLTCITPSLTLVVIRVNQVGSVSS